MFRHAASHVSCTASSASSTLCASSRSTTSRSFGVCRRYSARKALSSPAVKRAISVRSGTSLTRTQWSRRAKGLQSLERRGPLQRREMLQRREVLQRRGLLQRRERLRRRNSVVLAVPAPLAVSALLAVPAVVAVPAF